MSKAETDAESRNSMPKVETQCQKLKLMPKVKSMTNYDKMLLYYIFYFCLISYTKLTKLI